VKFLSHFDRANEVTSPKRSLGYKPTEYEVYPKVSGLSHNEINNNPKFPDGVITK